MNVTVVGFCALASMLLSGDDGSARHRVVVSMPGRLRVQRTSSGLSVSYDLASLRKVKITVGEKMILGVRGEIRVYPKGEARPAQFQRLFEGSVDEKDGNLNLWRSAENFEIPGEGKRYVVEHDLILFETDVPAQHMWSPGSRKNYRVLWEEKLRVVRAST